MDYFNILNMKREPFSNSPDPDSFFPSRQHTECLQKLELSIRLRRGLTLVIGDVGTGKTTLCRQLIRKLSDDDKFEIHLILDPQFSSSQEFLSSVVFMLRGIKPAPETSDRELKEIIKQNIFKKSIDEEKKLILLIDEGQKTPPFCLEILREFLNFETNEFKLLQIVIFSQKEIEKTLTKYKNFSDRINLYYMIEPMSFKDMRLMIRFRLKKSAGDEEIFSLFSYPALWAIYMATKGYPRRIVTLCHQCIMTMIIQNRVRIGLSIVRSCAERTCIKKSHKKWIIPVSTVLAVSAVAFFFTFYGQEKIKFLAFNKSSLQDSPLPQCLSSDNKGAYPVPNIMPVQDALPAQDTLIDHIISEKVKETLPTKETVLRHEPPARDDIQPLPKTSADLSDNKLNPGQTFPGILGAVILEKRETLYKLIESVYGVYNLKYLRTVISVNPQIKNPDRVEAGETILLPAIRADIKPFPGKIWKIRIKNKDTLNGAMHYLRSGDSNFRPVCLIPCWSKKNGLEFGLFAEECFFSEKDALNRFNDMSPEIGSEIKIVSFFGKDEVYFSDPFSS